MENLEIKAAGNKRTIAEELYTASVSNGFAHAYESILDEVRQSANNGLQECVISHPMFASVKTTRLDGEEDTFGPDYTPPQKRMVERLQEDGFIMTSIGGNFNGRNLRVSFNQPQ